MALSTLELHIRKKGQIILNKSLMNNKKPEMSPTFLSHSLQNILICKLYVYDILR